MAEKGKEYISDAELHVSPDKGHCSLAVHKDNLVIPALERLIEH